jgi:hypothetical protein
MLRSTLVAVLILAGSAVFAQNAIRVQDSNPIAMSLCDGAGNNCTLVSRSTSGALVIEAMGAGAISLNRASGGIVRVGAFDFVGGDFSHITAATSTIGATVPFLGLYLTGSQQGSTSLTLTDAGAAVSFVRIAVPTDGYIGGKVIWTATSTHATGRLTATGESAFAGSDAAGTPLCTTPLTEIFTPITSYQRVNTLACTLTAAVATTNCDLQVTCTDDLAAAQPMTFEWRLDMPTIRTVTRQ